MNKIQKEFIQSLKDDKPCLWLKENKYFLSNDELIDIIVSSLHCIKAIELMLNLKEADLQSGLAKALEREWS